MTFVIVTATGAGSFTVPAGVTSLTLQGIGGGGGSNTAGAGGGGGGAYAASTITVTPGGTLFYNVGAGGGKSASGADTWANIAANSAPASSSNGIVAKAGTTGTSSTAGTGGQAASCIGTSAASGGDGGNSTVINSGGGGAGGPNGAGDKGGDGGTVGSVAAAGGGGSNGGSSTVGGTGNSTNGGAGGQGTSGSGSGAGGTSGSPNGQNGTVGGGGGGGFDGTTGGIGGNGGGDTTLDNATVGSGGGGGAGGQGSTTGIGGNGGLYGGGGGCGATPGGGSAGGQGILVISYTVANTFVPSPASPILNRPIALDQIQRMAFFVGSSQTAQVFGGGLLLDLWSLTTKTVFGTTVTPTALSYWIEPPYLFWNPKTIDTNQSFTAGDFQFFMSAGVPWWQEPLDLEWHPPTIDTRQQFQTNFPSGWEPAVWWWKQAPDLLNHWATLDTNQSYQNAYIQFYEPATWWWTQPPNLLNHSPTLDTNEPQLTSAAQNQFFTPASLAFWDQPPDLLRHWGTLDTNEPFGLAKSTWEPGVWWWTQAPDLIKHWATLDTNEPQLTIAAQNQFFTPASLSYWNEPPDLFKHWPTLDTNQPYEAGYLQFYEPNTWWWTQPPNLLNHWPTLDTNEPQQTFAALEQFATPNFISGWWRQGEDLLRHPAQLDTNQWTLPFAALFPFAEPQNFWWSQPPDLIRHWPTLDTGQCFSGYQFASSQIAALTPGSLGYWSQWNELLCHPRFTETNQWTLPFAGLQTTATPAIIDGWWSQPPNLLNHWPPLDTRQPYEAGYLQFYEPSVWWWTEPPDLQKHWPTLDTNQSYEAGYLQKYEPAVWWWTQAPDLLRNVSAVDTNEPQLTFASQQKFSEPNIWWWTEAPDLQKHPAHLDTNQPYQLGNLAPIVAVTTGSLSYWRHPEELRLYPNLISSWLWQPGIPLPIDYGALAFGGLRRLYLLRKRTSYAFISSKKPIVTTATRTMSRTPDLQPPIVPGEQQFVTFDFGLALTGTAIITSVSAINISVVSGTDPTPSSRIIGNPGIVPSPAMGTVGAVSQKFGNMIGGVTYLLQCVVNTSDGQILSLETHWSCQTPS